VLYSQAVLEAGVCGAGKDILGMSKLLATPKPLVLHTPLRIRKPRNQDEHLNKSCVVKIFVCYWRILVPLQRLLEYVAHGKSVEHGRGRWVHNLLLSSHFSLLYTYIYM